MERPVGSFKSFIRTVPPNPSTWSDISPLSPSNQTLPPLLLPPPPKPTDSTVHITSWRAPTEWNLSPPGQPSPIKPTSTARRYSPLIPEPSPSLRSIRTESESWSHEAGPFRSPQLQPIHKILDCSSEPPPHNPSRFSPVQTPSYGSKPKSLFSPIRDNPLGYSPSNAETTHLLPQPPSEPGLQACSMPAADAIYQISNASRGAKAYVSLGIMWPRDAKTGWQCWSAAPHIDSTAEISRSLRGKKLPPLYRTSPFMDDECEDEELGDRLQLLSFSQDYHDVLADQYHGCRATRLRSNSMSVASSRLLTCGCISFPRFRSKTHELMPKPLAWRKGSGLRMKHKESTLWAPLRQIDQKDQRLSVDENVRLRSTRGFTAQHRKRIPDFVSHAKSLRANGRRTGSRCFAETEKSSHMSQALVSESSPQGYRSLLIRLPRGFALVRLSQAATSHSEATYSCDVASHENQRQNSSAVSDYPWRRSSFYNSSPPSSPFAYDIPPPLPVGLAKTPVSQSFPSPSQISETRPEEKCIGILPDEEIVSRGLMNRARDMRDAWRRHQREIKHDKIKKSIKVLGLMDSTVAAGYTKSWGRRLGDDRSD